MKRRITTLTIALFCLAWQNATAQVYPGAEDVLRFSNYNYGFGTARSAAMGGAFSSLGADLSSMAINPAGLGMYRSSEIGFSPSVTTVKAETENLFFGYRDNYSQNKTKFAINNAGFAFNVYSGSGPLTSLTIGFAYNKMQDFNVERTAYGSSDWTLLDVYERQAYGQNLENFPFNALGAALAYDTYMLDYLGNGEYGAVGLGPDHRFDSRLHQKTKGSIGQYDISMGMNLSNIVYLGLGFGLQDLYYNSRTEYNEDVANPLTGSADDLLGLDNVKHTRQTGSAWNFKFGAIIRPIEELRIGLAIHTPTYISMDDTYSEDMYGYFRDAIPDKRAQNTSSRSDAYKDSYDMQTPTRFIGGLSYTFANVAILSVDYERVWYNKMKLEWDGVEDMNVKRDVDNYYKPANNIRAGLEVVMAPQVFGRLGYAYYDSPYKGTLKDYGKTSNYSAGIGYRTSRWGIDFAYIFMDSKTAPHSFFYYDDGYDVVQSGNYTTKMQRHNFTLTTSVRF